MPEIRAFIAIELPQEVQTSLAEIIKQFSSHGIRCVRWVAPDNIHLTLQFLGEVPLATLTALKIALQSVAGSQEPFVFNIRGIGAFPNIRHPRVIWAGLQAPANLMTLQTLTSRTIQQTGIQVEDRTFSPHLTLGRVKRDAAPFDLHTLSSTLEKLTAGDLGIVRVQSITLFRSDLSSQGPTYTALGHFPLRG